MLSLLVFAAFALVMGVATDRPTLRAVAPMPGFADSLQAGDVIMLGLDICTEGAFAGQRPRVRHGDGVEIHMPGVSGLGVLRHRFVQEIGRAHV